MAEHEFRFFALALVAVAVFAGCAASVTDEPREDSTREDADSLSPALALPNVAGSHAAEPHVVIAVVDDAGVVFEGVPEGPPTFPGFARREYIGIHGAENEAWAVWVGGDAASGTQIEVTRITG